VPHHSANSGQYNGAVGWRCSGQCDIRMVPWSSGIASRRSVLILSRSAHHACRLGYGSGYRKYSSVQTTPAARAWLRASSGDIPGDEQPVTGRLRDDVVEDRAVALVGHVEVAGGEEVRHPSTVATGIAGASRNLRIPGVFRTDPVIRLGRAPPRPELSPGHA